MPEKSTLNAVNKVFILAVAVFHSNVTFLTPLCCCVITLLCNCVIVLLCCVTCACSRNCDGLKLNLQLQSETLLHFSSSRWQDQFGRPLTERERDRGGREGPPPSSSSSLLLIIIGAVTSGGHQPQGYKAEGGVTEQKAAKQQQQKHLTTLRTSQQDPQLNPDFTSSTLAVIFDL